ncbi:MAG: TolC family protein [Candidatus Cloacimonetes bacterium]|nr:TolC family protein [Candidatus Cloacimonadota bacterium]
MKNVKLHLVKIILWVATLSVSIQLSSLTIEESIEMARKNNKDLQQAEQDVEILNYEYNNVRGYLLPQISLSAGYSLTKTHLPDSSVPEMKKLSDLIYTDDEFGVDPTGNDTLFINNDMLASGYMDNVLGGMIPAKTKEEGAINGQIKLEQVIFMAELTNGLKVAKKVKTLQQKQYFLKEQEIVLQTKEQFYQLLLLKKVVEIQKDALNLATSYLELTNNLFSEGLASEYDVLRAGLEVEKLKPEIIQAENNYSLLLQSFKNFIGWNNSEELVVEGEIKEPELASIDLENSVKTGLQDRIEMDLSNIGVEIKNVVYKTEKNSYLPKVGLTASLSTFTAADEYGIQHNDFGTQYSVGIGLQMPLFTGLSNSSKTAVARHELKKTKIAHVQLSEMLELDIRNSYFDLQKKIEILRVQKDNVALAERALEIAQARYENNVAIQLELIDAQLLLKSSKLTYSNAVYDVIIAKEKFDKSIGKKL